MAARNRQRNGQVKDDQDEERNLWNQIITQVKQLQKVHVRATEISRLITSAEKEMSIDEGKHRYVSFQSLSGRTSKRLRRLRCDVRSSIKRSSDCKNQRNKCR